MHTQLVRLKPRVLVLQGGGWYLLGVQVAGIISISAWTFSLAFVLLKCVDLVIGLRLSLQHEILGADLVEHAVGDFSYDKKTNTIVRLTAPGPPNFTAKDGSASVNEDRIFQVPKFNQTHKDRLTRRFSSSLQGLREVNALSDVEIPDAVKTFEMNILDVKSTEVGSKSGIVQSKENASMGKGGITGGITSLNLPAGQASLGQYAADSAAAKAFPQNKVERVDFDLNGNASALVVSREGVSSNHEKMASWGRTVNNSLDDPTVRRRRSRSDGNVVVFSNESFDLNEEASRLNNSLVRRSQDIGSHRSVNNNLVSWPQDIRHESSSTSGVSSDTVYNFDDDSNLSMSVYI